MKKTKIRRAGGHRRPVTHRGRAAARRNQKGSHAEATGASSPKQGMPRAVAPKKDGPAPARAMVSPSRRLPAVSVPKKGRPRAKKIASPSAALPGAALISGGSPASSARSPNLDVPAPAPSSHQEGEGALAEERVSPSVELPGALSDAIANLASLHRSRLNFVSAKVKIELQIKAIQRQEHARAGCDKPTHAKCPGVYKVQTADIAILREMALKPLEAQAQARLKAMLEELPDAAPPAVLAFTDEARGFGRPLLAQVIAEAGDLARYDGPAKLWSRMGLGLGPAGETRYEGRSPRRRALMAVVGACFLKAGGPYKDLYDERKVFEQSKPSCGKTLKNAKGEPIGLCKDAKAECCKAGHIHNRTMRYVEKRLLRDLWRAWRNQIGEEESQTMSVAQAIPASSSPDHSRSGGGHCPCVTHASGAASAPGGVS